MRVVLTSILAETNIEAPPQSHFSDVFSKVCTSLGLKETWYFGVCYEHKKTKELVWLDNSRKILKKIPKATEHLNFRIKYYPEDVGTELLENITIHLFYLESRRMIMNDDIYCPSDTSALLACYSLQIEFGDFSEDKYKRYLMMHDQYYPKRVWKVHDLDPMSWTESIVDMWKKLTGTDPEDAMMEYLKLVQNLDMYGVTYFNFANKKKSGLCIGVTSLGVNIYTKNDKLTPQLSFSWSEIRKIKFKGRKLLIKFFGKKVPDFIGFTKNKRRSKQIYNLAKGNHELYIKRRKPDTPEVTILKEKAAVERELKQKKKEQQKLKMLSYEEALSRKEGYQKHLQILQYDLELTMQKIQKEIAEKLEETKKLQQEIERAKKKEEDYEKNRKFEENLRRKAKHVDDIKKEKEIELLLADSDMPLPETTEVKGELEDHLKVLRVKLEKSIRKEADTSLDIIHKDNTREGRDKFKTLAGLNGITCTKRIKAFNIM